MLPIAVQITEIPIHIGLVLSQDLGVQENIIGNLWAKFDSRNY